MRNFWTVIVVVLLFLAQVSCLQIRRVHSSYPPEGLASTTNEVNMPCNAALWSYIYRPQRLMVIEPCVTITGRVAGIHQSPDGDIHLRIKMDKATKLPINFYNYVARGGCMVAEIICGKPAKGGDGVVSCMGYQNHLTIPRRGDRVSITGSYVLDTKHGWREIHPITELQILK